MQPTTRPGHARPRTRRRVRTAPLLRVEELESRDVPALVAAYAFDENGGATVTDRSGNGLTGTVSSTAWAAGGKYGSALSFNGTSSSVTVADAAGLHLTTGMTLEAWVR